MENGSKFWLLLFFNFQKTCPDCLVNGNSEAVAQCKKMPVIPVNMVVDEERIIGKGGLRRRRRGTQRPILNFTPGGKL
jgi:hypothetical protein